MQCDTHNDHIAWTSDTLHQVVVSGSGLGVIVRVVFTVAHSWST